MSARLARWAAGLVLCLLWPAAAVSAATADNAAPGVKVLRAAQVQAEVGGRREVWRTVNLPYHWDRVHRNSPGTALIEARFDLPQRAEEPYTLYFPLIGSAAEVWLNDRLLVRYGELDAANQNDFGKIARQVAVPPSLLGARNLQAIGAIDECRRRGIRVPQDLSITGFDDIEHAAIVVPPSTTVKVMEGPSPDAGVAARDEGDRAGEPGCGARYCAIAERSATEAGGLDLAQDIGCRVGRQFQRGTVNEWTPALMFGHGIKVRYDAVLRQAAGGTAVMGHHARASIRA
ncbi:MAG: hypothetical protein DI563_06915 [Variovorax paradoxus]|uniref:Transcriptional regulator LacI/GalR-like sensor domain-containing protein n=1 Tax=Variovorax paradoxus TaxID=34073 RepID=A0A2W5SA20_VARPD|nr:MAG: hypothetical protein DI563_06915 [Variovorax paradoxus]